MASWPAYIVGDDPQALAFSVAVDDWKLALVAATDAAEAPETEIRRRYVHFVVVYVSLR